tara:strand:+ start:4934 stop:5344 length:411 start_codon:yes stop_codon:yes gene_type:complete
MYQSAQEKNKKEFKLMNFNHLMSIYETNYHNFREILNQRKDSADNIIHKRSLTIEDIFHDKFTRIFKIYHKFTYTNSSSPLNMFSIKPHLIFYMYDDAKLLEVKSLRDNKTFENSIQQKIKLNLNLFYWIKNYINH